MAGPEAAISLNVAMFRETRGALESFPSAHGAVFCWQDGGKVPYKKLFTQSAAAVPP